jgi:hypothetical protein
MTTNPTETDNLTFCIRSELVAYHRDPWDLAEVLDALAGHLHRLTVPGTGRLSGTMDYTVVEDGSQARVDLEQEVDCSDEIAAFGIAVAWLLQAAAATAGLDTPTWARESVGGQVHLAQMAMSMTAAQPAPLDATAQP